jgi:hypothetical protein
MNYRYFPLPFLCLVVLSCDKAKNLAAMARSAVEGEIAKQAGEPDGSKSDPELQKLVDRTPEGVIFRKDLPFPHKLEVKTTRNEEFSGRTSQRTELGNQVGVLKGTFTNVSKLERTQDKVIYTLVQSTFTEPMTGTGSDAKKPAPKEIAPPSKPTDFVKNGSSWKLAVSTDFRTASLAQSITPVFDQLLVEGAISPRPLWFSRKRLKIGDSIAVTEQSLPMVITGNAKGKLNLKLEAFEAVGGHPCGVFGITGSFQRNQFPDFDGDLSDEDVTIESGKLWLSLLHPLILKEEAAVIQTISKGGKGGLATRSQSSSRISIVREWKQL